MIRDSLASIDGDPRYYTSTVAADDLDDVRAALGYDRIDLYGTSYGGTLVQYYIRQHPDHVRVAILDGATPLDVPVLERIAVNSQHALDLLLGRCEQDASCGSAFPDIGEEWAALEAGLAEGITTTVVNPETGVPVVADLELVGPSIHAALLTQSTATALPLAIHLTHEGRWDAAGELIPAAAPKGGPTLLMSDEIFCSEAWARFDPAEVAAVGSASYATPAQLADAEWTATRCRYLPTGVVPANDGAPVVTDIPMLWLTADGDPQDPPANLASVGTQEPNSLVVVMPAQEHVVGHLGCGPTVIAAFLERGSVEGLDTSCITGGGTPGLTFRVP